MLRPNGFEVSADASNWADCDEAHRGLERACAIWIPWKLASGELAAVEAVLADVEPAVAERHAPALQAAQVQRNRLEAARQAMDLAVATRERRNMAIGLLVGALLVGSGVAALQGPEAFSPGALVALGAAGWWSRSRRCSRSAPGSWATARRGPSRSASSGSA